MVMKTFSRVFVQAAVVMGLCACSPLHMFNALVPKDGGGGRIATFSYGPDARQQMDLYRPTHASGSALPVIVFIYGGSWDSGDRRGYAFVGKALAAKGFLVAIPDYRLVPDVHYPAFLEDNAAAVRWVAAHAPDYGGQAGRLVLVGHSAGAYNAAMLALDPRWLGADRKVVRGFVGLAGPYDFAPFVDKAVQNAFAGVVDEASTQPIHYARADSPPALLATGDRDTVVRPRNSDALAEALRAQGVPVERLTYPRVGHAGLITAFAVPLRGKADILEQTDRFARARLAP
jgi:acetyl esterase/lipase